jgi:hypothetical protein
MTYCPFTWTQGFCGFLLGRNGTRRGARVAADLSSSEALSEKTAREAGEKLQSKNDTLRNPITRLSTQQVRPMALLCNAFSCGDPSFGAEDGDVCACPSQP